MDNVCCFLTGLNDNLQWHTLFVNQEKCTKLCVPKLITANEVCIQKLHTCKSIVRLFSRKKVYVENQRRSGICKTEPKDNDELWYELIKQLGKTVTYFSFSVKASPGQRLLCHNGSRFPTSIGFILRTYTFLVDIFEAIEFGVDLLQTSGITCSIKFGSSEHRTSTSITCTA